MSHGPAKTLRPADVEIPANHGWTRLPLIMGAIGVAGLVGGYLLKSSDKAFAFSYLVAYMFWLSIALGGLFFVVVQFASKAGWSVVVRRIAENAMIVLPVMIVLFIPVALGAEHLYHHWMHYEHEHHKAIESAATLAAFKASGHFDPLLEVKLPYLNAKFFYIRAAAYFAIWSLLGWYFYKRSVNQDKVGGNDLTNKMTAMAGPAIVIYALSQTFAAFDWMMSIDPHWYSTMYGPYYFAGSFVAIVAFITLISIGLRSAGLLEEVITLEHYHDLGKLLFAFMVFWAYLAFSQFMLYWYGNIPEETKWFAKRFAGGWYGISVLLAVGHFIVPFYYLMSRHIKRRTGLLMVGALWLMLMHYVDLYWNIMPEAYPGGPEFSLLDGLLFVGIGGVFMATFGLMLKRQALVPLKDPRLPESLAHENF